MTTIGQSFSEALQSEGHKWIFIVIGVAVMIISKKLIL